MTYLKSISKSWGAEYWLINNNLYCSRLLICEEDKWSSNGKYHYHKFKDETLHVIKGKLLLQIEGKKIFLKKGDCYRIEPITKHRFMALSKSCEVIELSNNNIEGDTYYE